MRPLELAQQYMDIFFGGKDVDALRALFAESFTFTGPLARFDSAEGYINALKADPPGDVHYKMIRSFEEGSSACLIYEFSKPGIRTPMAQLFETKNGKIGRIILLFDAAAFS